MMETPNQTKTNLRLGFVTTGKCQYLDCETLPWTSWSEVQTEPGHCRTEARYQRQRKTVVYREQMNNCNGVGPQTCPQDVTSKREKGISTKFHVIPP